MKTKLEIKEAKKHSQIDRATEAMQRMDQMDYPQDISTEDRVMMFSEDAMLVRGILEAVLDGPWVASELRTGDMWVRVPAEMMEAINNE